MPNNEMQWSSAHPGELIILIDQSGSMTNPYENGMTRSEFATMVVNKLISETIDKNFNGDKPKDRCHIAVIGYRNNAECLVSGFLSELDAMDVEVVDDTPMWVKPIYEDGCTNMKGAFELAKAIVDKWINTMPDNPAPVIINISDGYPYFNKLDKSECMRQTKMVVDQIKAIGTKDGKIQVFNVMIGDGGSVVRFPGSPDEFEDEESCFLYEISTLIPKSYTAVAESKWNISCDRNARGAIYNADGNDLIKFIDFGSSKL